MIFKIQRLTALKSQDFDEARERAARRRVYNRPRSRRRQERILQILALIDQQAFHTTRELAAMFGVHEATVNRDLHFIRKVKKEFWQLTSCEMRASSFKWTSGALRTHYSGRSDVITQPLPYRPELPAEILARWSRDAAVEELLGSSWNFVYRIRMRERKYALRITSAAQRSKNMLLGELDWVNYLSQRGVSVCVPIKSLDGELVETAADDHQPFFASVFEWADGRRIGPDDCFAAGGDLFKSWGKLFGRMHALAKEYRAAEADRTRPGLINDGFVRKANSLLEGVPSSISQICCKVLERAAALPTDSDCFGLIHADLHGGNLRRAGDDFVVFDFDECCYGWFGYDLACALYWATPSEDARKSHALTYLLEGYEREHAMSQEWRRRITGMIGLRRVIIYLTMRRELSTNPAFDQKLRERLKSLEEELLSAREELY